MFFNKKKVTTTNLQIALAEAQACKVTFRPGDVDSDFRAGDEGLRVMISDFGPYMPFILMRGSKDWIARAYELTDKEASKVYRLLVAKARKEIQVYERDVRRRSKTPSIWEIMRSW
ncbi:hypothetical protein QWY20_09290 [Alkalimonas sp. MEB108]|uniref:Uncharacterized protein n=1 Tax=Alkalimonas cellulosilytica TaxID=3058395 RepID=A0ABU7J564_9GAMM|nr:hypothetical protein [Alkalimonas sp. MEB108]MEE2001645.1 hypothetical protein [Alkalimonas sp. MEB108]